MYQDAEDKGALAFILNPPSSSANGSAMSYAGAAAVAASPGMHGVSPTMSPTRKTHSSGDEDVGMDTASGDDTASDDDDKHALFHIQGRSLLSSGTLMETRVHQLLSHGNHHGKMRVRKSSICAQVDCPRAAVSRGRCVRHGVRYFYFCMVCLVPDIGELAC